MISHQDIQNANLADKVYQALNHIEIGHRRGQHPSFDKKEKILERFYRDFELDDLAGELIVKNRLTGKVERDKYYNTLKIKQVLMNIARDIEPEKEPKKNALNQPTEEAFSHFVKNHGIRRNTAEYNMLYQKWLTAHPDQKVMQISEYWY